jgi:hypothetical protein
MISSSMARTSLHSVRGRLDIEDGVRTRHFSRLFHGEAFGYSLLGPTHHLLGVLRGRPSLRLTCSLEWLQGSRQMRQMFFSAVAA